MVRATNLPANCRRSPSIRSAAASATISVTTWIIALNGTGAQVPAKYHLIVTLQESSQTPLIDTVTGIPTSGTVVTTPNFQLVPIAGAEPVYKGHGFRRRKL